MTVDMSVRREITVLGRLKQKPILKIDKNKKQYALLEIAVDQFDPDTGDQLPTEPSDAGCPTTGAAAGGIVRPPAGSGSTTGTATTCGPATFGTSSKASSMAAGTIRSTGQRANDPDGNSARAREP